MSKVINKGWEKVNDGDISSSHLSSPSSSSSPISSISSSAKSFADIMSEDLIAFIMKEEQPINATEAGGGGRGDDGYFTGELSQEQKSVVDSLAELLMDNNKAFAEAALRRQRFDFERAADFYFQNQESFDAFVLEDASLSFATTNANTTLDSDSVKREEVVSAIMTATDVNDAREVKDSLIASRSFPIDADSDSNSSNSTSSSGDIGAALKASDDTLSDENVAAISDECIAALLQELYDKGSYDIGDDENDDYDYDEEDTEGSSNTSNSSRNHPSYHQSNTFRDAIELKNDLLHFYGGYSGGNPQALHPLMDESTSSAFGVRDYSLKNSEKDLPLFKGKVTVTHAAEFVSKHDPLLQGLQNSKSLSGMYGVGDLIGSQILVKNTEANAIKVFSNKLDSAHNNRKPKKNKR